MSDAENPQKTRGQAPEQAQVRRTSLGKRAAPRPAKTEAPQSDPANDMLRASLGATPKRPTGPKPEASKGPPSRRGRRGEAAPDAPSPSQGPTPGTTAGPSPGKESGSGYSVKNAAAAAAVSQSKVLVSTVTDSFMDRLLAEAERHGGHLSAQDLQSLSREFTKKAAALEAVFQHSFEQFGEVIERAHNNMHRYAYFDRLMVKRISHLFPEDDGSAPGDGEVSRRVLPGYLMAVNQMLGAETAQMFKDRAHKIVDRLRESLGHQFDWDRVYADPEADDLVLDVLVHALPFFRDMPRREEWFVRLINSNLPPFDPDQEVPDAERDWKMDPAGFRRIVTTLFAALESGVGTQNSRQRLVEQQGEEAIQEVEDLLTALASET